MKRFWQKVDKVYASRRQELAEQRKSADLDRQLDSYIDEIATFTRQKQVDVPSSSSELSVKVRLASDRTIRIFFGSEFHQNSVRTQEKVLEFCRISERLS